MKEKPKKRASVPLFELFETFDLMNAEYHPLTHPL